MLVYLLSHTKSSYLHDLLYPLHQRFIVFAMTFDQFFQSIERQLISLLVFTVILIVFLNCVVCQMNVEITDFIMLQVVLIRRSPQIAPFEYKNFEFMRKKYPHPNIKFPPRKKQRSLQILLNHKRVGSNDKTILIFDLSDSKRFSYHSFIEPSNCICCCSLTNPLYILPHQILHLCEAGENMDTISLHNLIYTLL